MNLLELLANQPPIKNIDNARFRIKKELIDSSKTLVIIDDDPMGIQTVQDVPVLMEWSVDTLRKTLATRIPVFYVCTNSRSLTVGDARTISYEVGKNLREAVKIENRAILLASRGDSTLRGHFPHELMALVKGFKIKPDGIIVVPAFFEGGRYTIRDIHWVEQNGNVTQVHQTEFARDPVFGFKNGNLKDWVAEKMGGLIKAEDVRSISLQLLRTGGTEAVTRELLGISNGTPVIVNAASYEDLDILALAIEAAEGKGKIFVYYCAASFIKARGGFENKPLLTRNELMAGSSQGLILVGSYVDRTTNQLKQLLSSGLVKGIELEVTNLWDQESQDQKIRTKAGIINRILYSGKTAVLYTSRRLEHSADRNSMETGSIIMDSLCRIIKQIQIRPNYLITKGGSTSLEIARTALGAKEAFALGQILPGVPVWRLGEGTKWSGITQIIFPGNVGDEKALLKVVSSLSGDS